MKTCILLYSFLIQLKHIVVAAPPILPILPISSNETTLLGSNITSQSNMTSLIYGYDLYLQSQVLLSKFH